MKVLIATPDLYRSEYKEFTKNKTGFGLMVYEILRSLSEKTTVSLISNKISPGHQADAILRHGASQVLLHLRLQDILTGLSHACRIRQNIKQRLKCCYYQINKGYIKTTIKEYDPDIVHIQSIGLASLPYIEVCRELETPFLVTLHGLVGLSSTSLASMEDKLLERDFLRGLRQHREFVSVVSSGIKKRILQNYSPDVSDYITVVPNGRIECDNSNVSNQSLFNLPVDLKSKSSSFKFIVVGSLCEHRNQLQILDALSVLNERYNFDFEIAFCGADTLGGKLQAKIKQLGFEQKAHCLGFLSRAELAAVYEWADCNVVASKDEGFGLSMIEAPEFGLPTVAFADLDAIDDIYTEDSMILVKERSTEALASGLLAASKRVWDVGKIRMVSKRFSSANMAAQYIDLYNKVIAASKGWVTRKIRK